MNVVLWPVLQGFRAPKPTTSAGLRPTSTAMSACWAERSHSRDAPLTPPALTGRSLTGPSPSPTARARGKTTSGKMVPPVLQQ